MIIALGTYTKLIVKMRWVSVPRDFPEGLSKSVLPSIHLGF